MKNFKTCPNCQRDIPESEIACEKCGYIDMPDKLTCDEIISKELEDVPAELD
jgi:predicted amidophosphoribosyltransferase